MKRILTISAAVILLLLIFVYAYLGFRQNQSYKMRVHQEADFIFRINVDGIIMSNGFKFLQNPSKFLTLSKDSAGVQKGFTIPANIFVYTVRSRSVQTYFCTLPVSDTLKLKQYLQKVLHVVHFKPAGNEVTIGHDKEGQLTIAYNPVCVAFSYSMKKENTEGILLDLMANKNVMEKTDVRLGLLKSETANLAYHFKGFSGAGELTATKLLINGQVPLKQFDVPRHVYGRNNFQTGAAVKAWLNADFHQFLSKERFCIKGICLEGDTLLKYYGGYADLEIGHATKQKDSVVTYGYNDDFEKTEQIEVKEINVPGLNICFDVSKAGISAYLKKQAVINSQNQLSKTAFPLYKVYIREERKLLQFATDEKIMSAPVKVKSPNFFFVEIDFDQLRKQELFPLITPYFKGLKHLTLKAMDKRKRAAQIELEVHFDEVF